MIKTKAIALVFATIVLLYISKTATGFRHVSKRGLQFFDDNRKVRFEGNGTLSLKEKVFYLTYSFLSISNRNLHIYKLSVLQVYMLILIQLLKYIYANRHI